MRIGHRQVIRLDYSLVTVQVLYFVPGYHNIIQEFLWQTRDLRPRYPRIQQFLDYWRREIDAVIKEVTICDANNPTRDWSQGFTVPFE